MSSRMRSFVVIQKTNTSAPLDHCAAIELADIDKGFLPNRLTTDERDAIADPTPGLTLYNTDTNRPEVYNGISWVGGLVAESDLADLNNPATARANLGLGSAATVDVGDFDSASAGMVLLASGTITDPVEYLDLTLPEGYSRFDLDISRVAFSVDDGLVTSVSQDDGTTYLNDLDNFNTYQIVYSGLYQSGSALLSAGTYAVGYVMDGTLPSSGIGGAKFSIYPGAQSTACERF
jgi:hypothetical protein